MIPRETRILPKKRIIVRGRGFRYLLPVMT